MQVNDTATELVFHKFWINDTTWTAQVFFDIHTLKDVTLEIYIGYEYEPNVNQYDFTTVLPTGR